MRDARGARVVEQRLLPHERADAQPVAVRARSPSRPATPLTSTSAAGLSEPQLHQRHEALAAGEHARPVTAGEQRDRLVDASPGAW